MNKDKYTLKVIKEVEMFGNDKQIRFQFEIFEESCRIRKERQIIEIIKDETICSDEGDDCSFEKHWANFDLNTCRDRFSHKLCREADSIGYNFHDDHYELILDILQADLIN